MTMRARLRREGLRQERGVTLVELLIAVTLMGMAFVALLGGLGVFFRTSNTQRSTSDIDSALRTYVEQVVDAAYVNCATSYTITPPPSGMTATVTIRYWDGQDAPAGFTTGSCTTDKGAQQITVRMTQASTGTYQELTVVKRAP